METFKYCPEIPLPPQELCDITVEEILAIENKFRPNPQGDGRFYTVHNAKPELIEWAKGVFDIEPLAVRYQVIRNGISIHTDIKREWCYNFILNGANGITEFYLPDKTTLINSVKIEERRWHWMNNSIHHTVSNVEGYRYAITVFQDKKIK